MSNSAVIGLTGPTGAQGVIGPQGPAGSGGSLNGFINAEHQVWQRGAGGSASFPSVTTSQYCADRFAVRTNLSSATGQTAAVSQVAGALSTQFLSQVGRVSGGTSTVPIYYGQALTRNASVPYLSGQSITFSFSARAGANFSPTNSALTVAMYANASTVDGDLLPGSSNGSSATASTQTVNLTTTLTRYTVTFAAPLAATTQLGFYLIMNGSGTAGSSDYFQTTDWRIDVGTSASPIVRQRFEVVLNECLPYYEKSYLYSIAPKTNNAAGYYLYGYTSASNGLIIGQIPFRAIKRATPTLSTFSYVSSTASNASYVNSSGGITDSTPSAATPINVNLYGFQIQNNTGSTYTTNQTVGHYVADSELN